MQFIQQLSFSSFNDAWETYNTHYHKISLDDFYHATQQGYYINYNIKDIINIPPDNLDVDRLLAKTVEEAYPVTNRPRGIDDIKSVKYHMKSPCVSPIIIIKNKNKEILIDGVHRLVAAKLAGKRKVLVYIININ
jgi:hypothetical protein